MKKYLLGLCLVAGLLIFAPKADAALPTGNVLRINGSATGANVNAGTFNWLNPNFPTDGTVTAGTGNTATPEFSSASYTATSTDVGADLYIKAGTTGGAFDFCMYNITSVSGGKMTLNAAAGQGICRNLARDYSTSTVAGIDSVGTPTGLTWGIDYSQSTIAYITFDGSGSTPLSCTLASNSVCTYAGTVVGNVDVNLTGNGLHINTGTNATTSLGVLYSEILSVSGGAMTLDHNVASGTTMTVGTARVGGASSMNSGLDAEFLSTAVGVFGVGASDIFVAPVAVSAGEAWTFPAANNSALTYPVNWYCVGSDGISPQNPDSSTSVINVGANVFSGVVANPNIFNCSITGSGTSIYNPGSSAITKGNKIVNTSTTVNRTGVALGNGITGSFILDNEISSYRGNCISIGQNNNAGTRIVGNYIHNCGQLGLNNAQGQIFIENNIFAETVLGCIRNLAAITTAVHIANNTCYGMSTPLGVGIDIYASTTDITALNNIVSGFATAASSTEQYYPAMNKWYNNNFFNYTTLRKNVATGTDETYIDPQFTDTTTLTVSSASSTTNVLTCLSCDFSSVTNNEDFLILTGGAGTTLATSTWLLITAHTATTTTVSSNITSAGNGTSLSGMIQVGHNYSIGTNLKAGAIPGVFPGALTTGYIDIGAVQRQEQGTTPVDTGGGAIIINGGLITP